MGDIDSIWKSVSLESLYNVWNTNTWRKSEFYFLLHKTRDQKTNCNGRKIDLDKKSRMLFEWIFILKFRMLDQISDLVRTWVTKILILQ